MDAQRQRAATADPTRPRGPGITFAGGLVLFMCLFLPAVESCGEPIRPIEVPWLAWPHFMGMFAAVGAMLALLRDRSGPEAMALVLYLIALTAMAGTGVAMLEDRPAVSVYPFACVCVLLASMRKRPWRMGPAVWLSGLLSCVWLGVFAFGDHRVLYGLWLAMAGALMLTVGGALWDLDTRPRADTGEELPRATMVSGSGRSQPRP